jgi:hypothetical protein
VNPHRSSRNAAPPGDFESLRATRLFCPRCRGAQPVEERILLVLPDGDLYEYVCQVCWTQLGKRKVEAERPPLILG